jgi:putative transposase
VPRAHVYTYLLRNRVLTHADEVWSSDITYVPMRHGFRYLTAVIDQPAGDLQHRQGSQFTAEEYTGRLEKAGIAVSRDGRGRA